MRLTLDPMDLAPQFQSGGGTDIDQAISTRDVTFDKLNTHAQIAVLAVGRATFYSWDGLTYNAVYPPREAE